MEPKEQFLKELGNLRVTETLFNNINKCLDILSLNESGVEINLTSFRRIALNRFSQKVMKEGLSLNWELENGPSK